MSSIYRVKKDRDYSVISNTPITDKNLTWEARGVLAYLLSKPDGWEVRNNDLIKQSPAGKHKVKRIIKELKDHYYMYRYQVRNDDGTIDWVTEVYELPQLHPDYPQNNDNPTIDRFSVDGSSGDGESDHIVSTDRLSTEKDICANGTHTSQLVFEGMEPPPAEVEQNRTMSDEEYERYTKLLTALSILCYGKKLKDVSDGAKQGVIKIVRNKLLPQGHTARDLHIFAKWWKAQEWTSGRPSKPSVVLDHIQEALEWHAEQERKQPASRIDWTDLTIEEFKQLDPDALSQQDRNNYWTVARNPQKYLAQTA